MFPESQFRDQIRLPPAPVMGWNMQQQHAQPGRKNATSAAGAEIWGLLVIFINSQMQKYSLTAAGPFWFQYLLTQSYTWCEENGRAGFVHQFSWPWGQWSPNICAPTLQSAMNSPSIFTLFSLLQQGAQESTEQEWKYKAPQGHLSQFAFHFSLPQQDEPFPPFWVCAKTLICKTSPEPEPVWLLGKALPSPATQTLPSPPAGTRRGNSSTDLSSP